MFVPATPEGELARTIQENDDKIRESTGERKMKVVERGGSPSERNCVKTTPGGVLSVEGKGALVAHGGKKAEGESVEKKE